MSFAFLSRFSKICLCNEGHFDIWALRYSSEGPEPFKENRVARLSNYKIIFVASFRNFMHCSSTCFHQVWFRCKVEGASEVSSRVEKSLFRSAFRNFFQCLSFRLLAVQMLVSPLRQHVQTPFLHEIHWIPFLLPLALVYQFKNIWMKSKVNFLVFGSSVTWWWQWF